MFQRRWLWKHLRLPGLAPSLEYRWANRGLEEREQSKVTWEVDGDQAQGLHSLPPLGDRELADFSFGRSGEIIHKYRLSTNYLGK